MSKVQRLLEAVCSGTLPLSRFRQTCSPLMVPYHASSRIWPSRSSLRRGSSVPAESFCCATTTFLSATGKIGILTELAHCSPCKLWCSGKWFPTLWSHPEMLIFSSTGVPCQWPFWVGTLVHSQIIQLMLLPTTCSTSFSILGVTLALEVLVILETSPTVQGEQLPILIA